MTSFAVIGPGRCGTRTTHELIQGCRGDVFSYYEDYSWLATPHRSDQLDLLAGELESASEEGVAGVVGLLWGYVIREIRERLPGLRVVCLHRPPLLVASSYLRIQRTREGRAKIWGMNKHLERIISRDEWMSFAANYNIMMNELTGPVLHLATVHLGDTTAQQELFEFLRIPAHNQVFQPGAKYDGIKGV